MNRYASIFTSHTLPSIPGFGMLLVCLSFLLCTATPALANQQSPGGTGSVLNILFLGIIAYFLVRMFRRRSGRGDDTRPGKWSEKRPEDEGRGGRVIRPMDRHEAARQMWGHLSSETDRGQDVAPSPAAGVAGFDEAEFLEGAKMFFSRFQQAYDKGEFDDLRGFLSDDVYNQAVANAQASPVQGTTQIMLLNARLMEMKSENDRTQVTVFYDGQIRRGGADDTPEHLRVVWEFSRDDNVRDGLWTLDKINKVDQ